MMTNKMLNLYAKIKLATAGIRMRIDGWRWHKSGVWKKTFCHSMFTVEEFEAPFGMLGRVNAETFNWHSPGSLMVVGREVISDGKRYWSVVASIEYKPCPPETHDNGLGPRRINFGKAFAKITDAAKQGA